MSDPEIAALSTRHTCLACGGSCHGVRVKVFDKEQARIEEAGRSLGVERPLVDGHLRVTEDTGACVFLSDAGLCRIHAELGPDVKPTVCGVYPLVLLKTESELRAGLDPGCYTSIQTWKTADELPVTLGIPGNVVEFPTEARQQELSLLRLFDAEGVTLPRALSVIASTDDLSGLFARFFDRLAEPAVAESVQDPTAGAKIRQVFAPILALTEAEAPPPLRLTEQGDAYALEVARRMVYLRLASSLPSPFFAGTLALLGGVAAGWAYGEDDHAFGKGMSAWSRVMRRPRFWSALFPDGDTFTAVVRGA